MTGSVRPEAGGANGIAGGLAAFNDQRTLRF